MKMNSVYETYFNILSGIKSPKDISLEDILVQLQRKIEELTPPTDSESFTLRERYVQTKAVLEDIFNC